MRDEKEVEGDVDSECGQQDKEGLTCLSDPLEDVKRHRIHDHKEEE